MKPEEGYALYKALKMHFTTDNYDFFKYKGQIKISQAEYEKRNLIYTFSKISKLYDREKFEKLLVANFLQENYWIGDILSEKGREIYQQQKKVEESLTNTFSNDIDTLIQMYSENNQNFDWLFTINENNIPIVTALKSKQISFHTFIIMDKILGFFDRLDKKMMDETVLWPDFRRKVLKSKPFFDNISVINMKRILKSKVLDK